jgi:hypothetical protein
MNNIQRRLVACYRGKVSAVAEFWRRTAVFQSDRSIRGEPVESFKLRYFNSFEFFDHTGWKESDTPRGAGGLVSGAASKAVVPLVEASR